MTWMTDHTTTSNNWQLATGLLNIFSPETGTHAKGNRQLMRSALSRKNGATLLLWARYKI